MEYEWLSAREAVLRRPDTHVGAVEPVQVERVVLDEQGAVRNVNCECSPALLKIFDEIVTNALDHTVRDADATEIRITISAEGGVTVCNNGTNVIPTGLFKDSNRHTPEILFTELNAGSNLKKVNAHNVGGRNGIGGTVTALFSTHFELDICNAPEGTRYQQSFRNNLDVIERPRLTKYGCKKSKVTISFVPDFARLNMPNGATDADVRALLVGRAVDAAACTSASVYVNGVKLPYKTLRAYALAFGGEVVGTDRSDATSSIVDGDKEQEHQYSTPNCQVVVSTQCEPAVHVCFVNGVRCVGTLYNRVLDNVVQALRASSASSLNTRQIHAIASEHVSVFISARINTPAFGSQSKDKLDTPVERFGFAVPSCTLIGKRVERMSGIKQVVEMHRSAADAKLVKKTMASNGGRTSKNIKKLERATDVGKGRQCTLWIAEGDSAKAMIVAGFTEIGRRYNGVYPLRGKMLNVWDHTMKDAMQNAEISDLISILNLDVTKTYDSAAVAKLPYRLMVTTDQDDDGSHIFGLVLALFYRFFPSVLAARPGFVTRFVTPVVKVHPSAKGAAPLYFFALSSYRRWAAERRQEGGGGGGAGTRGCTVAYYKGLGTNTDAEARYYFRNMTRHTKTLVHLDSSAELMKHSFSKACVAQRRDIIVAHEATDIYDGASFTTDDFCTRELPAFWAADNERSIPSAVDGFKPSQRKVLFTILQHGKDAQHKVAQLATDAAKRCNYHHGEVALSDVIVKMAQDFLGTNNVNLLQPVGQFGNRHGDKAAQPRYIFTRLEPYVTAFFPSVDMQVLTYMEDEGRSIEPKYFVPVVPFLLVNGSEGIGTGYSTFVPAFAVGDVIDACRAICSARIEGTEPVIPFIAPFVNGFTGETVWNPQKGTFAFHGLVHWTSDKVVVVTELPPSCPTNRFKDFLHDVAEVDDVVNHGTLGVDLRVTFKEARPKRDLPPKMAKRLVATVSLANLNAFDASGRMKRYTIESIFLEHAEIRLALYETRRLEMIRKDEEHLAGLDRKIAFVDEVVTGRRLVVGVPRSKSLADLHPHGEELLAMSLDRLTTEGMADLDKERHKVAERIRELQRVTAAAMWNTELDHLEAVLAKHRTVPRATCRVEEDDVIPEPEDTDVVVDATINDDPSSSAAPPPDNDDEEASSASPPHKRACV